MAAVAVLIMGGGKDIVWASSLGAVLAGAYIVWKRWGNHVDKTLVAGIAIAVAGAGVFGFALAEKRTDPATSPTASAPPGSTSSSQNTGILPPSDTSQSTAGTTPPTSTSTGNGITWLAEMKPVNDVSFGWERGARTVNATSYERSLAADICIPGDGADESFNLERKFQRFQATVGIDDNAPGSTAARFIVVVDEKEVFRRDVRLGDPASVDVPVSGGLRLEIRVDGGRDGGCGHYGVWGDASLR